MNVEIDADCNFVTKYFRNQRKKTKICEKILYASVNFIITYQMMKNIKIESSILGQLSLIHTLNSKFIDQSNRNLNEQDIDNLNGNNLRDLSSTSLQQIPLSQLIKYLYIFDANFFDVITPLNFAYFTKYTLEEAIILLIIAIVQNTDRFIASKQIMHAIGGTVYQYGGFLRVKEPQTKKSNSFCFISYPNNPFRTEIKGIQKYLQSISKFEKRYPSQIRVMLYLPYEFSNEVNKLLKISSHLLQAKQKGDIDHGRLRIRANKAVSAFAVYQSAYLFCPLQSIMLASRHNIQFQPSLINEINSYRNEKYHYFHTNYIDENGKENILDRVPQYEPCYARKYDLFRDHFRHVQILKTKLAKTLAYWVLKSAQIDFYQTQVAMFILAMQTVRLRINYINKTLYRVSKRNYSKLQEEQIQAQKKYIQYTPLPHPEKLIPYKYNCLENFSLRRFASNLMPKFIHQIWMGKSQISEVRWHLHRAIRQKIQDSNFIFGDLRTSRKKIFQLSIIQFKEFCNTIKFLNNPFMRWHQI